MTAIKIFCEGFKVNIGGIHMRIKFFTRFVTNIACGDGNGFYIARVAGLCDINGIFMKNNGIIISKSD